MKRDCTIHIAKTKTLISCAVTTQLVCVFVFACAKIRFFLDAAHFIRAPLAFWNEITTKAEIKLAFVQFRVLVTTFDMINANKVEKKTDTFF